MLASYHEVILHMTQKKVKAKKLRIGNIPCNQIVELQVFTEKKGRNATGNMSVLSDFFGDFL